MSEETFENLGTAVDAQLAKVQAATSEVEGLFSELVRPFIDREPALVATRNLLEAATMLRTRLIDDAIQAGMTDRAIARASGVSHPAIGRRRVQLDNLPRQTGESER